ncbi:FxSxx-COOH system tetratricopeptide repeat protein [Dictyobacter aurantiacus]|uniref:TIR domain-containing protein n=1 Tax=Dictyobacter aurantiacus TaxID=1936993 RepID=A0A401ZH01_9CHLR|nr:FxSxx-COOH system tetratricopeptide repeat protein [Dictyobacter aurantiacus]GCE06116.1 hypothetical protein KDAU_34450 [Dictyobacter aurantiacus]
MEQPSLSGKAIKVFYSYAHEDEAFRKDLEKHLSTLRRRGVISEWHDRKVVAGANWEQEIDQNLSAAHLILFLVSADFLDSDYCYGKEMKQALEQQTRGKSRVVPILVRSVSWEDAPFNHLQVLPRDGVPIQSSTWLKDEAWTQVVKELRKVIAEIHVPEPEEQPAAGQPQPSRIFDVPHPRNPFFTGREEILQQLHISFAPGHSMALTQSIGGLGGIGKTQIAIEYAYRYQQHYRYVFWINADTSESLQTGFVNIASLLHLPLPAKDIDITVTMNALREWFRDNEHWLLILDNADDLDLLNAYQMLLHANKGHILITTRAAATGGLTARTTSIEPMAKEDAALLLLRRAKVLTPEATLEQASEKMRKDAEVIVAILDGLPLALDQASAYLEETGSSLANYVSFYQQRHSELLNERGRFALGHPQPVAATWSLSFQVVEQANPAAAELLRFCAFLQPDAIPIDMFIVGRYELGSVLEPVADNLFTLDRAIGELLKFSLVKRSLDRQSLQLHRLVQAVLRDTMDMQAQKIWMERVIQVLLKTCYQLEPKIWEQCQPYVLQAQHLLLLTDEYNFISSDVASIFTLAGNWLAKYFFYVEAEPLFERALRIREQVQGPEHPSTATNLSNLAFLYEEQGRYAEAEPLFERALRISEQGRGPEHPSTAINLNNLAILYEEQGRYAEAEPLFERALRIREQVLGPEHPSTATNLNNLGLLYKIQGRYAEAEPLYERALRISEQVQGSEHPDTATSLNNLAILYEEQGRYAEAEPLYERALRISEQVQGPEHPSTATSLSNLALLYKDQGRYAEAEPLFERALRIREQVLGPEHPKTKTAKGHYLSVKRKLSEGDQCADN